MKNIKIGLLLLFIIIGSIIPNISYANETEILTLTQARILARKNIKSETEYNKILKILQSLKIEQTENIKNKKYTYDKEGNESMIFIGDIMTKDYEQEYDNYLDTLNSLKLENEKKAIVQYTKLLNYSLDLKVMEFKSELLDKQLNINESKFKLGVINSNEYESTKTQLTIMSLEKGNLLHQMDIAYKEMNTIIGYEQNRKYILDENSLLEKNKSLNNLELPVDIISLAFDKSDEIDSFIDDIEKLEREMDNTKTHNEKTNDRIKEYDIKKQELEKIQRDMSFDIDKTYNNLVLSIKKINQIKDEIEFQESQLKKDSLYLELGMITQFEYISKTENIRNLKNDLLVSILDSYNNAIEYKRIYIDNPDIN